MRFRFLYLDKDGVETKVESVDDLRLCVEDGRIGEDTLLYDARSREWGPARVHTAYRSIVGDDVDADDDLGAGLDPADIVLTDAVPDTVGRFLERRAKERKEEDERRATALDEMPIVDESAAWQRGTEGAADEAREAPPEASLDSASDGADDLRGVDEPGATDPLPPRATSPEPEPKPDAAPPPRPQPSPVTVRVNATGGRARRRRRYAMAGGAVVVAAGLFGVRAVLGGADAAEASGEPVIDTGPPPAANPEMEARIREAEGSAFQDMVLAMDSLRVVYDVTGGPREWLTGRYLSSASEFADVAAYWDRYGDYVDELRARDEELFRRGFVQRLEHSGLDGAVLSMRLARATEEFRSSGASREAVYSAMAEMASVALELHTLLVEREADIVYTPVRPGVVTRDPVVEAVPTDAELRARIWDTLDRLFAHMDVVRGGVPGSGEQLGEAALEGIRNTARRYIP